MTRVFIHGLDSSTQGTKARFFRKRYPDMRMADYTGSLVERMEQLEDHLAGLDDLILVGSSFGGLMAALLSQEQPERVRRLILLAPALNYHDFVADMESPRCPVRTLLFIGSHDIVTPPSLVVPAARAIFTDLTCQEVEDDHLLHKTFDTLPWEELLEEG